MSRETGTGPIEIHATALVLGPHGLLLRGPSNSGKSSLALALIQMRSCSLSARLVSDDITGLKAAHGRLIASAPPRAGGLIEIRGQGVFACGHQSSAVVTHIVDLSEDPDRIPEPDDRRARLLGFVLPVLSVKSGDPLGAEKIRAGLTLTVRDDL